MGQGTSCQLAALHLQQGSLRARLVELAYCAGAAVLPLVHNYTFTSAITVAHVLNAGKLKHLIIAVISLLVLAGPQTRAN